MLIDHPITHPITLRTVGNDADGHWLADDRAPAAWIHSRRRQREIALIDSDPAGFASWAESEASRISEMRVPDAAEAESFRELARLARSACPRRRAEPACGSEACGSGGSGACDLREEIATLLAPHFPRWPVAGEGVAHEYAQRRGAALQAILDAALAWEREVAFQAAHP